MDELKAVKLSVFCSIFFHAKCYRWRMSSHAVQKILAQLEMFSC